MRIIAILAIASLIVANAQLLITAAVVLATIGWINKFFHS